MTPEQQHEMIAGILDRASSDDLREWAWNWLELFPSLELSEVARRVLLITCPRCGVDVPSSEILTDPISGEPDTCRECDEEDNA